MKAMNTGDSLQKKNNLTGWAFISLAVIGIVAFYFYPMLQALLLSFKSGVGANLEFTGLDNYKGCLLIQHSVQPCPIHFCI